MGKDLWIEIMNDDNNTDTKGRITGCIWQTSIMRDNFERFGGFISMDTMKRHLTSLD